MKILWILTMLIRPLTPDAVVYNKYEVHDSSTVAMIRALDVQGTITRLGLIQEVSIYKIQVLEEYDIHIIPKEIIMEKKIR